jgi:hypothetical protein
VWCGVVWCGVVWCGVVWCGGACVLPRHAVPHSAITLHPLCPHTKRGDTRKEATNSRDQVEEPQTNTGADQHRLDHPAQRGRGRIGAIEVSHPSRNEEKKERKNRIPQLM